MKDWPWALEREAQMLFTMYGNPARFYCSSPLGTGVGWGRRLTPAAGEGTGKSGLDLSFQGVVGGERGEDNWCEGG